MSEKQLTTEKHLNIRDWLFRMLICNIPVIGTCFLLSELTSSMPERKRFAAGFLLYKVIMTVVLFAVLYAAFRISIPYVEQLLQYMESIK